MSGSPTSLSGNFLFRVLDDEPSCASSGFVLCARFSISRGLVFPWPYARIHFPKRARSHGRIGDFGALSNYSLRVKSILHNRRRARNSVYRHFRFTTGGLCVVYHSDIGLIDCVALRIPAVLTQCRRRTAFLFICRSSPFCKVVLGASVTQSQQSRMWLSKRRRLSVSAVLVSCSRIGNSFVEDCGSP